MGNKLLFSLTAKDFTVYWSNGTGKGGQKRNKVANCCRIIHEPSGAMGTGFDERSHEQNKKNAFVRLIESDKFKSWMKIEIAKQTGVLDNIEQKVEQEMNNIKIEIQKDGKWTEETK